MADTDTVRDRGAVEGVTHHSTKNSIRKKLISNLTEVKKNTKLNDTQPTEAHLDEYNFETVEKLFEDYIMQIEALIGAKTSCCEQRKPTKKRLRN